MQAQTTKAPMSVDAPYEFVSPEKCAEVILYLQQRSPEWVACEDVLRATGSGS